MILESRCRTISRDTEIHLCQDVPVEGDCRFLDSLAKQRTLHRCNPKMLAIGQLLTMLNEGSSNAVANNRQKAVPESTELVVTGARRIQIVVRPVSVKRTHNFGREILFEYSLHFALRQSGIICNASDGAPVEAGIFKRKKYPVRQGCGQEHLCLPDYWHIRSRSTHRFSQFPQRVHCSTSFPVCQKLLDRLSMMRRETAWFHGVQLYNQTDGGQEQNHVCFDIVTGQNDAVVVQFTLRL